ncbi:MAG: aspartyl/glutamyl-tRNA amidotransferase subunit A [Spirochaetes bacterium]|nr:aspartyl/glutamyl-tRNA amidotransferase subunit A [Spirochaetota bacterium]
MEKVFKRSFFLNNEKETLFKNYEININNLNKEINAIVHFNNDYIENDADENYLLKNKKYEKKLKFKFQTKNRIDSNNTKEESKEFIIFKNLPVLIKDNICFNKLETTCCSDILQGYIPSYNADVVNFLLEANCNIIGNTNMDEFAMGSTTETSCYGPTKNPLNFEYIPGGSSGGSAASVAADMVPIALGSDTGGSVRQPASLCGIYGFKPSWGAISRYGLIAFASSLDQIGIFTKSAFDMILVFSLISQFTRNDMTKVAIEKDLFYFNKVKNDINYNNIYKFYEDFINSVELPNKIAVFKNIDKYISCKYTKEIYKDYIRFLEKELKINIFEIEIEYDFNDILGIYYIIAPAEASSNLARYDSLRIGKKRSEGLDVFEIVSNTRYKYFNKEVKRRINIGNYVLSAGYKDMYYKKALVLRNLLKERFDKIFDFYDLICLPTTPSYLKKIGEEMDPLDIYASDIFTVIANILEVPSISIPIGINGDNKTGIGLQFMSKKYKDYYLLEFVNYLEYNS